MYLLSPDYDDWVRFFLLRGGIHTVHSEYKEIERPDWIQYFLGLSFFIAERSEDAETRIGAVLVNEDNHIIGTGYNSFASGISHGLLPNTRPAKYDHMIHAEENALISRTVVGRAKIFVSARPCLKCLYKLKNGKVDEIYYANTAYQFKDYEKEKADFDRFVNDVKMKVFPITPEFSWLNRATNRGSKFI